MATEFDGNTWRPAGRTALVTCEGAAAVNEAIDYLRNASPLGALTWNIKLEQAATFHTNDIGPKGLI